MERLSTCICIYKNAAVGRQQRAIRENQIRLQSQYLERKEEEEKEKKREGWRKEVKESSVISSLIV